MGAMGWEYRLGKNWEREKITPVRTFCLGGRYKGRKSGRNPPLPSTNSPADLRR
jgi:hypothetical protein